MQQNTEIGTSSPFAKNSVRIFQRELEFLEEIGNGTYGVVWKALWNGLPVAVKKFRHPKGESPEDKINTEVSHLYRLKHSNIVCFYGRMKPDSLVVEFADVGSLHKLLHCTTSINYTAGHAINWAKQCAEGAAYLHDEDLVHRDLKPDNLLLFKGGTLLKICDFGTATLPRTKMTIEKGTPPWMAPEVITGTTYNEKCDVYSFAIILWELASRQQPYKDANGYYILYNVAQKADRPPPIEGFYTPISTLMTDCWNGEPTERPCMREVAESIQGFCGLYSGEDIPIVKLDEHNTTTIKTHASESPKCYIQDPDIESDRTKLYRLQKYEPTTDKQILGNSKAGKRKRSSEMEQGNVKNVVIRSPPPVQINNGDIKNRKIIFEGTLGIIWYKATLKKETVALKLFQNLKNLSAQASFITKAHQLAVLIHPNIVKLLGTFTARYDYGMVLKFAEDGTLDNLLHNSVVQFSFNQSINWAQHCAAGVAYLHNMKPTPLIHRDLQPSNLLLFQSSTVLKIGGFGMATELETEMTDGKGTARWMAPEVCTSKTYNEKCDSFSFGILLWEIRFRELPFKEINNDFNIMMGVVQGNRPEISLEFKSRYPLLVNLMEKCWHEQPGIRPAMDDVITYLQEILAEEGDVP